MIFDVPPNPLIYAVLLGFANGIGPTCSIIQPLTPILMRLVFTFACHGLLYDNLGEPSLAAKLGQNGRIVRRKHGATFEPRTIFKNPSRKPCSTSKDRTRTAASGSAQREVGATSGARTLVRSRR